VRSAKGSFAWITSPLLLRRFAREGGLPENLLPSHSPRDDQAMFTRTGPLAISATSECRIVLEEYVFFFAGELPATREGSTPGAPGRPATPSQGTNLGAYLETLLTGDSVWKEVVNRLVIVSDGMMSFFCQSACEVAQHVAIDDGSGLARPGTLYNQENVPSDTMFYGCLNCFADRIKNRSKDESRLADEVLAAKLQSRGNVLQFGADASTGLGLCTVELKDPWQKAE
jgi:CRISPR-associated protein Cmr4